MLQKILEQSASKLNIKLSIEGGIEIAKRSRGTPRIAGRLLRRIRDISSVKNIKSIDKNFAIESLEQLDVDKFGLDALDRKYMQIIIQLPLR